MGKKRVKLIEVIELPVLSGTESLMTFTDK